MPAARSVGRPALPGAAKAAIVRAADALFYERGIAAVSVHAIAARAGVTRRTLYYHFAGKDQLVVAHLEARDRSARDAVAATASIPAVFEALERFFCQREYRGCALTNAVFENGPGAVVTGRITKPHKAALRDWFVAAAHAIGARDPVGLGEGLMLVFDGALLAARTRRDPRIPRYAQSAARALITAHGADPDTPLQRTGT